VESLDQALKGRTAEAALGALYERLPEGRVRCFACGHRCTILPGFDGVCKVRFNRDGTLYAPRGYVAGLQVDPIEKKPFFHAFPGADALSFGMLGCDLHCGYCQNWLTSQALRDPAALERPRDIEASDLVRIAQRRGAPVMVTTYNEPLITSEWAVEVFTQAKAAGIVCGYVSNGNGTPEVLRYIRPVVDLYKVDLKSFRDKEYRKLGGTLAAVQETIRGLHAMGFWVELVTLLIPGLNDDPAEVRDMARFIASVSRDIPWHVTAYHPDYRMEENRATTVDDLLRACGIGLEEGLRFVYAGNLPGRVGDLENTRCPGCRALLVERHGYHVRSYRVTDAGTCPECALPIAGHWRKGWTPPVHEGAAASRRPRPLPIARA